MEIEMNVASLVNALVVTFTLPTLNAYTPAKIETRDETQDGVLS